MVAERKISFVGFWFEGLTNETAVKNAVGTLARLGYTGVDWKNTCFDTTRDMAPQLKMAKKVADDMGIATCNAVILGDMVGETREKYINDTISYVRACAEAGIPSVNCVPGGSWTEDKPEAWDKLADALNRITKVCDETGTDLAIESVAWALVHDFPSTQKMYTYINNRHMKVTLDPSHYHVHKTDIPAAIRWLGKDRIAHVHVKDAIGDATNGSFPREWIFPILGEGNIEWNGFFKALDDIGYDNYMSIEFEAWRYMQNVLGNDVPAACKLSMQSMQALISNYIATIGK